MKPITLLLVLMALLALCGVSNAQTPTQIKQVLPSATSQVVNWDYNVADEPNIDAFVVQRTAFSLTSTITSPYAVEVVVSNRSARTFTVPLSGLTAGQKAFFRVIARRTTAPAVDSATSNVIEIEVVATPPGPTNFRFP